LAHWDGRVSGAELKAPVSCAGITSRAAFLLPGYDALSPHCRGALFSLMLNRGGSFDKPGPHFAEMRDIKASIKHGALALVPALLRSMKRI